MDSEFGSVHGGFLLLGMDKGNLALSLLFACWCMFGIGRAGSGCEPEGILGTLKCHEV